MKMLLKFVVEVEVFKITMIRHYVETQRWLHVMIFQNMSARMCISLCYY